MATVAAHTATITMRGRLRRAQNQIGLRLGQRAGIDGGLKRFFHRGIVATRCEFLERTARLHEIGLLLRDDAVRHGLGEAGVAGGLLGGIELVDGDAERVGQQRAHVARALLAARRPDAPAPAFATTDGVSLLLRQQPFGHGLGETGFLGCGTCGVELVDGDAERVGQELRTVAVGGPTLAAIMLGRAGLRWCRGAVALGGCRRRILGKGNLRRDTERGECDGAGGDAGQQPVFPVNLAVHVLTTPLNVIVEPNTD